MYNAIHGARLPMRGDTLDEGIAVNAPDKIPTAIIRPLVAEVGLVTEDQSERAVATLIAIEKTVVEGASASALAAVLANPSRFAGRNVGLVLSGGNIDTRFFFSSRRRHTRLTCDWSSDVCSSDLVTVGAASATLDCRGQRPTADGVVKAGSRAAQP